MALIVEASRWTENTMHIFGSQGTAKDLDIHLCCSSRVETAPELACVHMCLQHGLDRLLLQSPAAQSGQEWHRDSLAPVPNGEG